MLSRIHYDALDWSSSRLLVDKLDRAAKRGDDLVHLFAPTGAMVAVPTWAVTCCLAERQEQEAAQEELPFYGSDSS